jgi:hypothetical protein
MLADLGICWLAQRAVWRKIASRMTPLKIRLIVGGFHHHACALPTRTVIP